MSLLTNALFQFAVAGLAGSILACMVLLFKTGDIPPESESLTYGAYGMVIGMVLFLFANIRHSKKQKAAYVANGGDPTAKLSLFMFGDMGEPGENTPESK